MSGAPDGNAIPVRAACLAVLALLCGILLASVDARGAPTEAPGPTALTPTVGIAANPTDAERGQAVAWTAWLNLTGSGLLEQAWVNVTFDAHLVPEAASAAAPSRCTLVAAFSWSCPGLGAGSHIWTFRAVLSSEAPLGDRVNATVRATTYDAGSYGTPPAASAGPRVRGSEIELTLLVPPGSPPGGIVRITVFANNTAVGNASDPVWNMTLTVELDAGLLVDSGTALDADAPELTVGSSLSLTVPAVVAPNATVGSRIAVTARVTYEKYNRQPAEPIRRGGSIEVLARPGPVETVLGALGTFLALVLAGVLVLLVVGQRRVRIDEAFLMHRSGILIQHHSRGPALKKDDDLVASMLVAVQEFVRDSFRSEATLDEFSFGGRRAAIVRGRYVVLAAILSRGNVRYLVPQLQAAIRDVEAAHGSELANWDGRISRLGRAGPIIETLLAGGYRGTRAWVAWTARAKALLGRTR